MMLSLSKENARVIAGVVLRTAFTTGLLLR